MSRSTSLLLLVALLLVGIPAFPDVARAGGDIPVNSFDDAVDANPGDLVCETAAGNGVCTLRAAINEANARPVANSITLPAGEYLLTLSGTNEDSGLTGDLDILSSLTIVGAGADLTIIDGNQLDRVFDIRFTSLIMSGVTVRGGLAPTDGGGGFITSGGSTLRLTDCVVSGNGVAGFNRGGGVFAFGSAATVILTRVTLQGNSARFGGGAISNRGNMTISESAITGNWTLGATSAIENDGASASLTITNSTISGNTVGTAPPTIRNLNSATLNLTNVTSNRSRVGSK